MTINVRINQPIPLVVKTAAKFGGVDLSGNLAQEAYNEANTAYILANTAYTLANTNVIDAGAF